ncbi:MAG: hypothetical protein BalsKO_19920 [Balneolaceae bacterium]
MDKAKIVGSAPILLVKDVEKSANYYRDKIGFTYERFWGDPPGFCILHRGQFSLMLSRTGHLKHIIPHYKVVHQMWNVYFWVDDAKKLYDEFIASGAIIDYHLTEKDYGCLEFGIQDLDGYDIAFGQEL